MRAIYWILLADLIKAYDKVVRLYLLQFPTDGVCYDFLIFSVPFYIEVTDDGVDWRKRLSDTLYARWKSIGKSWNEFQ